MPNIPHVPIDWAGVNWLYVAMLAVFVFLTTLIGTLLSFKRAFLGAVLSALLFAAVFVFWTYYPHGLPLPTSLTAAKMPATPAAARAPPTQTPPADVPVTPTNPVTAIPPATSPPDNPQ